MLLLPCLILVYEYFTKDRFRNVVTFLSLISLIILFLLNSSPDDFRIFNLLWCENRIMSCFCSPYILLVNSYPKADVITIRIKQLPTKND